MCENCDDELENCRQTLECYTEDRRRFKEGRDWVVVTEELKDEQGLGIDFPIGFNLYTDKGMDKVLKWFEDIFPVTASFEEDSGVILG